MECLKAEGVDVVFGYPGGANLPTYDAFVDAGIRHVLVRHEAGGGHAAEGYAKASGKVGVVFATSGPGATNIVTPLTDAMMDSVPIVAFTGQVRTDLLGTDGFQEADTFGITMPIVKHSFMIQHPVEIPRAVHEAFHLARSGRPGPVLIDMPVDLTRAEIDYHPVGDVRLPGYQPTTEGNSKQIRLAAKALANARRPVVYAGGGVINSDAAEELLEFVTSDRLPITCTLMALGAFPAPHAQWLGMPGMHGTRTANYAMDEADLILAVGARFDDRVTGKLSEFAPRAKFVHIDIDPAEISKNVPAHIPIVGDAKNVLTRLTNEYRALGPDPSRLASWWERIEGWQAQYPLRYDDSADAEIKPQFLVEALYRGDGRRLHPVLGRRPAPDVGCPVLPLRQAAPLDQLRRAGHHGLRAARGDGRRGRQPVRAERAADRRRLVPDEQPGAGHLPRARHPGEGRDHEQRLSRHGPPVAGAVLGRALLERRHGQLARLGQARRGLRRHRRAADRQDHAGRGPAVGARDAGPGRGRRARHARGEHVPDDPGRLGRARDGRLTMGEPGTKEPLTLEELEATTAVRTGRKHILSILVENKPGVLTRIAGLFARRGFNIDTLAVGPTDDETLSRITLTLDGAMHPIDQVTKQLHKLVNVIKIRDLEPSETVARELALFKVTADGPARGEVMQIVEIFRGKIIDVTRRSLIVEVTGEWEKIEAFERMVRPFGLVEMARTGEIAISRGRSET